MLVTWHHPIGPQSAVAPRDQTGLVFSSFLGANHTLTAAPTAPPLGASVTPTRLGVYLVLFGFDWQVTTILAGAITRARITTTGTLLASSEQFLEETNPARTRATRKISALVRITASGQTISYTAENSVNNPPNTLFLSGNADTVIQAIWTGY